MIITPINPSDRQALAKLQHSVDFLLRYQVPARIPQSVPAKKIVNCRHCKEEFAVTQPQGECKHHSGKLERQGNDLIYTCCKRSNGAAPCARSTRHVYSQDNAAEACSIIPFVTVTKTPKQAYDALALDCEMGYTSLGSEVLRLTVVDFVTEKTVLDVYVKPKGQVWDYATRYSGVTSEHMVNALSLEDARAKLINMMSPQTILIGHGLDHDLVCLRLAHAAVIDTSLFFPHQDGLPKRRSLKVLAMELLGRHIQADDQFHNPVEDALTALHIVKQRINRV
ncbi:hypothetical protein CANCADRAFT_3987 [Tortispora caseinolytica NRRL Y-17796]|uniref:RNA exonuclease 3 n=1 Tax=Tortispora caseinolytica NRRL Y-17796 TaxID=767744 RepID=A0A1E4TC93_9ASCO|nr:hypothetical protein CANCADRAFT_3987 [Tortispora caseinolytica NRRL Y-17796]